MPSIADGSLRFAVSLHLDDPAHREAMGTVCELLTGDVGCPVRSVSARSPSQLAELLAEGEADFGWVSPTLLLMAPELATMVPLLSCVRQGVAFYHSVVFTAADSLIRRLDDLQRVRAAWVAPTSAAGYIVPRLTLARRGVDPATAFREELFVNSHGEVARAVFGGRAAIGGTFAHFRKGLAENDIVHAGYEDVAPFAEARILAVSGPIPADMIVCHPDVAIADRIAFAAALSRLVHDPVGTKPIDTIIGAEDFAPVSVEVLQELQALMKAAGEL